MSFRNSHNPVLNVYNLLPPAFEPHTTLWHSLNFASLLFFFCVECFWKCIFPIGESREGKKLKTSQAEFTTSRLTDEPHISLSVTGESLEVMRMPWVPLMAFCVFNASIAIYWYLRVILCKETPTWINILHVYLWFGLMRFHCGRCTSTPHLAVLQWVGSIFRPAL